MQHVFAHIFANLFACAWALSKCMKVLVAYFKFLASETFKLIYIMYFAHIFAIFLHMHGSWASVWKFWLHFWNSWLPKHLNQYTTCILHTFLKLFSMCTRKKIAKICAKYMLYIDLYVFGAKNFKNATKNSAKLTS